MSPMMIFSYAGLSLLVQASLLVASPFQTVYRTQRSVVLIDVAVDDGRKPVSGLTKDDFELRDNGVLQEIIESQQEAVPIDVSLIVDVSGSMKEGDREKVEYAVTTLSGALRRGDRMGLSVFSSHLTQIVPMSGPPLKIDLSAVRGDGGSVVMDALMLSLIAPPRQERRRFVLVMTDGADNGSFFDDRTVVATAQYANAPVTVLLTTDRSSDSVQQVARSLAAMTGGEVIRPKVGQPLDQALLGAFERFRNSYVLAYYPSDVSARGFHEVSVRVKSGRYKVRARHGYMGSRP